MAAQPLHREALRTEQWLLLAVIAFYVIAVPWSQWIGRPGFLDYDEEGVFDIIQAAREGAPLRWQFGAGSFSTWIAYALSQALGPNEAWLRLPSLLATLLQAALLHAWVRPRLGAQAAAWAVMIALISTVSFALARGTTAIPLTSAAFLAHALLLDRLNKPWQALLWGLSIMLFCLEYEGWIAALAVLLAWALWRWRRQGPWLAWLAGGIILGGAALGALGQDWSAYVASRRGLSLQGFNHFQMAWQNLLALLGANDRMLISAAPFHPWPPRWMLPLAFFGLLPALKRWPALAAPLLLGSLPLFMRLSDAEPHRFYLAWMALCAIAGYGAQQLAQRRWGSPALLALLVLGSAAEIRGWWGVPPDRLNYAYGRSDGVRRAIHWLRENPAPEGWSTLSGLSQEPDGAFRYLRDAAQIPPGERPVAFVTWDYQPGLLGMQGATIVLPGRSATAALLYLPDPAAAARLTRIGAELKQLRERSRFKPPVLMRQAAWEALHDGTLLDPWSRTVAWEQWITASLQVNDLDPHGLALAAREPLVSGWFFDAAAHHTQAHDPAAAQRLSQRALKADPRRAALAYRAWRN